MTFISSAIWPNALPCGSIRRDAMPPPPSASSSRKLKACRPGTSKRVTQNNYWNEYADTLEWTLPCPPPEHTFEQLPKREDWDKSHAH